MSFRHGKNGGVLVAEHNLSSVLTEFSSSQSIETSETTTFSDSAKTYITSLNDGTISFSGLYDGTPNLLSETFEGVISSGLPVVITLGNDGGLITGRKCTLATANQTSYEISVPVADVVSVSGEFQVTGGIRGGVLLAGEVSETASATGTAIDNTASTTNGAVANLHVTANTMDNDTVIKVQHSADNSTWADLITFATVATLVSTSETKSVTGTINRYLRYSVTPAGSGSITLSLSISRRN